VRILEQDVSGHLRASRFMARAGSLVL
jgi:hypothetical protein